MKLLTKIIYSAFFAAGVCFSMVGADVAQAQDVNNELSFQGRVRGWWESSTSKANSDADTTSESKFQASSRLGVTGKTVKGDWTAKVKLEIEAHEQSTPGTVSTTARDAWVSLGTKVADIKIGRQWMPDFGGNNTYSAMNSLEDTVGGLGRTEGAVLSINSIPNLSLKLVYSDVVDGNDDVTAYQPYVSYAINDQFTVAGNFTSKSIVENEDKSWEDDDGNTVVGDSQNRTDEGTLTVFGKAEIGQFAPYIGFESGNITESAVNVDDADSTSSKLMVGVDVGLGEDMGIYAEYVNTTLSPDEGDDKVTSNLSLAFEKQIAHTEIQIGYNSETVDAGDNEDLDGQASSSFVAGLRYNF